MTEQTGAAPLYPSCLVHGTEWFNPDCDGCRARSREMRRIALMLLGRFAVENLGAKGLGSPEPEK